MNVFCLGGKVIGSALAWELFETFLKARFSGAERHQRRVDKVRALEMHEVVYWLFSLSRPHSGANEVWPAIEVGRERASQGCARDSVCVQYPQGTFPH